MNKCVSDSYDFPQALFFLLVYFSNSDMLDVLSCLAIIPEKPAYFLMRDRKGVDPGGMGGEKELEGAEEV